MVDRLPTDAGETFHRPADASPQRLLHEALSLALLLGASLRLSAIEYREMGRELAKMREIQNTGRVVGLDRIAVMAALKMANDLLRAQARDRELDGDVSNRLKGISDRVDSILVSAKQLDL